jgi:aconitate hydratase
MLPFTFDCDENALPFDNGDYIFVPGIKEAVKSGEEAVKAYVGKDMKEITLNLPTLTEDERTIILDGCLINYYRNNK